MQTKRLQMTSTIIQKPFSKEQCSRTIVAPGITEGSLEQECMGSGLAVPRTLPLSDVTRAGRTGSTSIWATGPIASSGILAMALQGQSWILSRILHHISE